MLTKRAQIWSLDLFIAISMMMVTIAIFFVLSINMSDRSDSGVVMLLEDGRAISNFAVGTGSPDGWTLQNMQAIGVTDGQRRLNTTKLAQWEQLAQDEYNLTKRLLSTDSDYYIRFMNRENAFITIEGSDGFGKPGTTNETLYKEGSIAKIQRFMVYNKSIVSMVIYVW